MTQNAMEEEYPENKTQLGEEEVEQGCVNSREENQEESVSPILVGSVRCSKVFHLAREDLVYVRVNHPFNPPKPLMLV